MAVAALGLAAFAEAGSSSALPDAVVALTSLRGAATQGISDAAADSLAAVPADSDLAGAVNTAGVAAMDSALEYAPQEGHEVNAEDEAQAGAPAHAPARRLQATLGVWCVCDGGHGTRVCGGMYFSLMQCDPLCPSACHSRGFGFEGCNAVREVTWIKRMGYRFQDCSNSPLAHGR
eukprot:CAMPEP_0170286076 /NCGR_PEP_ID=MMETSP0116_2-20130129/43092_1 /TAXON_ID=400756 /ORGANISM="Durinskia baltica, Strain CSIRO CS-38" /LENGTH=175 /DNA_ID=CAMNT_0010537487 /DNA_START=23 /DNA_END=550 /DNA_ORIENTATION=+